MGQYYRPVFLKENTNKPEFAFSSYPFNNGAKLMEHYYVNNYLCLAVEHKMYNNPRNLVWAGDYADEETEGITENLHTLSYESFEDKNGSEFKTGCVEIKPVDVPDYDTLASELKGVYVINHTKKTYFQMPDGGKGYVINPLPLLTAEGNGRGGGDYTGTYMDLVGSWSRDLIELSHDKPNGEYTEDTAPEFEED